MADEFELSEGGANHQEPTGKDDVMITAQGAPMADDQNWPLLEGAGVASRMDEGFIDVSGSGAAKDFIETCGKLRFWDRAAVNQD